MSLGFSTGQVDFFSSYRRALNALDNGLGMTDYMLRDLNLENL